MAMTQYEDSDPFEDMTEDEIQQLMELGVIPKKQDALAQQLAQATALRNKEGPQGRDSGRVYTAASPLEHIAHAAQGIMAGRNIKRLQKEQQGQLDAQVKGRSAFLKAMYGKKPLISIEPFDPESVDMPSVNF